ncbi:MAG: hypothetical protein AABX83_00935 [Nanoarchaeota archaeon]
MKVNDRLQIIVHILNFVIFLYFSIILIRTNPVDIINIIISAIGLFGSLVISIIEAIERTIK